MKSKLFAFFLALFLVAAPLAVPALPFADAAGSDSAFVEPAANSKAMGLAEYHATSTATTMVNGPFTINGTVAKPMATYEFTTTGHIAQSWNASVVPIAPGLSLSSSGFLTGTPTKAGTFTATVSGYEFPNFVGPSASALFTFIFAPPPAPPAITNAPANQFAAPGSNAVFTVGVSGSAPLHFQWQFDGANIARATNAILQLTNVAFSQAGVYTVTVTNKLGSASTNVSLTVESPPAIVNQPMDAITTSGSALTLAVAATPAPLAYQWFWNSNSVAGATNPTLAITISSTSNSGYYAAVVSNGVATVSSRQARVLVVDPPGPGAATSFAPLAPRDGQLVLSFQTLPGYQYTLQSADSIPSGAWTAITNIPAAFGGELINVPASASAGPRQFYRVVLQGN
jgi:hypothetical protein